MKTLVIAMAALSLLGACTTKTRTASPPAVTRSQTYQDQLVFAAGLTNVPKAASSRQNTEIGTASGAGMAVTGALNGVGGLSNLAAGGFGFLTFLTSPPAGAESWDHLIVELPAGASPDAFAAQVQKVFLKPVDGALRAKGYAPQAFPEMPGQVYYAAPGCARKRGGTIDKKCSYALTIELQPKGRLDSRQVYLAVPAETSPVVGIKQDGLNAPILRRVADAFPSQTSVYVAPRRMEQGWTPPMLYSRGKPLPL